MDIQSVKAKQKDLVQEWVKSGIFSVPDITDGDRKMYVLGMFPYPSGEGLHMGHVRIYTGVDVLSRFFRMKGFKVLNPMGWDAFGLPAENYAIKKKTAPQKVVKKNIQHFKNQILNLGYSYDWEREFSTTDPEYYRFTQFIFIQLFKAGLLYKRNIPVYFCPFCKTGLAEEEVLPDGKHERCGKKITRKLLPQWMFRITDYADSLLEELPKLDWPKGILEMQSNWIGKSEGAEISFPLKDNKFSTEKIKVFTTRLDTIFGVTALILAPEHKLVEEILSTDIIDQDTKEQLSRYVSEAKSKLDLIRTDLNKEKTGVFTGVYAMHPLTGEEIPVWVADYVLGWYGEGAVMFVPAHDERDYEFAKKHNIKIKIVVKPKDGDKDQGSTEPYTKDGVLVDSGKFSGLTSEEARRVILKELKDKGLGKESKQYKLRDWIFSRQRYWGEPIPMVYCKFCAEKGLSWIDTDEGRVDMEKLFGSDQDRKDVVLKRWERSKKDLVGWFPLSEDQLPLILPEVEYYEPTGTGESPLSKIKEWVETSCPNCGSKAVRETDTMPNWAGSNWYFLAFAFWNRKDIVKRKTSDLLGLWRKEIYPLLEKWLPVDWYLGGAEHAVLHLLYSRFWIHALYDLNLVPVKEPFARLRNVGMLLAEDHRKMSKSLGNVVNPDDWVSQYGADIVRLFIMFIAPFNQEVAWSQDVFKGMIRFVKRFYQACSLFDKTGDYEVKEEEYLVSELQRTIQKVDRNISDVKFNTAIAHIMEFLNHWEKTIREKRITGILQSHAESLVKILAPFAPFLTEIIWREIFGRKGSIHTQEWPKVDKDKIREMKITLPVQVNGKTRDILQIPAAMSEKEIIKLCLSSPKIKKYVEGREYKVVYVPGKIVNFVI